MHLLYLCFFLMISPRRPKYVGDYKNVQCYCQQTIVSIFNWPFLIDYYPEIMEYINITVMYIM